MIMLILSFRPQEFHIQSFLIWLSVLEEEDASDEVSKLTSFTWRLSSLEEESEKEDEKLLIMPKIWIWTSSDIYNLLIFFLSLHWFLKWQSWPHL